MGGGQKDKNTRGPFQGGSKEGGAKVHANLKAYKKED